MARLPNSMEREELEELYKKACELVHEIDNAVRGLNGEANARAYWLASLKSALNNDEYFETSNFNEFLKSLKVHDKDGNFIEEPDEDGESEDF